MAKKSSSTKPKTLRPKPWTIKRIEALSPKELKSMTKFELARLASAYQKQFRKRTKEFKKAGLFSHAEEQVLRSFKGRNSRIMNKETGNYEDVTIQPKIKNVYARMFTGRVSEENVRFDRNTLLWYNTVMNQFFAPAPEGHYRTNTVEGIRQLNREQDLRLFGSGDDGFSNEEERRAFWRLYDEMMNAYGAEFAAIDYVRVIKGLSEHWRSNLSDKDLITQMNDAFVLLTGRRPDLDDFDKSYINSSSTRKSEAQSRREQNFQEFMNRFGDSMLRNNLNRDSLVSISNNTLSDGTVINGGGFLAGEWDDELWRNL